MPVQRVSFLLQLRPDRVEDYLTAHQDVWPEMREALRSTGWRNYSLFVREDDGLVVGYLETDDFESAQRDMAALEVNHRWQRCMAEYFTGADGSTPDRPVTPLRHYFHLE
ncbi:L-rhamnose mutarotase [Mycolicibacterium sp. CBM1]